MRPGDRVVEVGAAKSWAAQHLLPRGCEYVACDLVVDRSIGLGRGQDVRRGEPPRALDQDPDPEALAFAGRDAFDTPGLDGDALVEASDDVGGTRHLPPR